MPKALRQWQTRFLMSPTSSDHRTHPAIVCLYGKSVDELRQTVRTYLLEKKPLFFSNRGDHVIGQMKYAHSDGKIIPFFFSEKNNHGIPEGWWYRQEISFSSSLFQYTANPQPSQRLRDLNAAVDHFITYALIPERGPDYQSKAVVGDNFRLPFLEKVLRAAEEHLVNDLIGRGWHIIALEYKGELSMAGELTSREAIFVLGHPEAQVATNSLNADSYDKEL